MTLRRKILSSWRGLAVLGLKSAEALLGAAMTIYLARVLGPTGFGYFAFGLATVTLLAIPVRNGASNLVTRHVAVSTNNALMRAEAGSVLAAGLWITLVYSMIPVTLSWSATLLLAPDNQFVRSVALFSLALPVLTVIGLIEGVLRGAFRPNAAILAGTILVPALTLLVAVATAQIGTAYGWQWATGVYVASALTTSLIGLVWARAQLLILLGAERSPRLSWRHWQHVGVPLMLASGLLIFNRQIDVILLGMLAGEREAGIYRLSAQAAVLVTFGVQAIGHLYAPHLAAADGHGKGDAVSGYLKKSVAFSLVFGLAVLALLLLAGDDIILGLAGSDYLPGYGVMLMLCTANLAAAANGAIIQALYMQGHQLRAARIFAATALVSVMANSALIPFFGIYGAATASSLAIVLWSLGLRWLACRVWKLSFLTLNTRGGE